MTNETSGTNNWPELWLRFRNGDMDAFHRIYVAFLDKLYAYGSKLTSDEALLEDSIQELFLQLYTHRDNLSKNVNLEFYLLKSLKLILYQKHRKKGRFVVSELNEQQLEAQGFVFTSESMNLDEVAGDKKLNEILHSLDQNQRELLYLKFYGNLSYKEIGELLHIHPDSAKKQVYRILSRLKEKFSTMNLGFFICALQHV